MGDSRSWNYPNWAAGKLKGAQSLPMAQKVPDEPYPKESKQCQEVLLASVNTVQELITQMSSSAGGEQIKPVILYEANLMMQPHLTYIDVHLSDSVHATESS